MADRERVAQGKSEDLRVRRSTRETKSKLVTKAAAGSIPGSLHMPTIMEHATLTMMTVRKSEW